MAPSTLPKRNIPGTTRAQMNTTTDPGPRTATIQRIMAYSRSLVVVNAPPVGEVCIILN